MDTDARYISIKESLEGACKEVNLILQGKLKGSSWEEVINELKSECGNEVVIP